MVSAGMFAVLMDGAGGAGAGGDLVECVGGRGGGGDQDGPPHGIATPHQPSQRLQIPPPPNHPTGQEATTFFFDCKPAALEGALARFSQFFVAPLIKADALEREVLAVDNEFSGVRQSDGCRAQQLRAATAVPRHVLTKFGWGNRASLQTVPRAAGVDVRAGLVDYYRKQYSAERMALVLVGGQGLDALERAARDCFAGVPSGRGPRPSHASEGYPFVAGPRFYCLPAVRQGHHLQLTFQFPCLFDKYRRVWGWAWIAWTGCVGWMTWLGAGSVMPCGVDQWRRLGLALQAVTMLFPMQQDPCPFPPCKGPPSPRNVDAHLLRAWAWRPLPDPTTPNPPAQDQVRRLRRTLSGT